MVNAGQRKVASIKSFLDSLAMRSTAYVTTRPRYGVLDVVGLLFRELLLMVVVFLLIFALGAAAVFTLKKTYTAQGAVFAGVPGRDFGAAAERLAPEARGGGRHERSPPGGARMRPRRRSASGPVPFLFARPRGAAG